MSKKLKNIYPSVFICLPLCLGILFSKFLNINLSFLFISMIILVGLSFYKKLFSISILIFSFFLGISIFKIKNNNLIELSNLELEKNIYCAKILEEIDKNEKTIKYLIEILYKNEKIKTICYVSNNYINYFKIGDYIFFNKKIYPLPQKDILDPFDYKNFMLLKGISHSVFILDNEILSVKKEPENISYKIYLLKKKLLKNLEDRNLSKQTISFTFALILGDKSHLDKSLIESYSNAGVTHLLAVSGLHLGILIVIFMFFLSPLNRVKSLKFIKIPILIFLIWFYALIVNFSPSISRACTMFTFIIIGNSLKRNSNIYNSLAISAILLLIINPNSLFDAGFQFSYLALFFIFWLQPFIFDLLKIKNKILSYFWKIITVSFSAQIGVLPISLYYFGKLPLLFLLSNIILIPIIGIILFLSILIISISFIPYKLPWIFLSYDFIITKINSLIIYIASFQEMVLDIKLELYQVFLVFSFSIFLILFFKKRKYLDFQFSLIILLFFQFSILNTFFLKSNSSEIVSFNTKNTLICIKNKTKVFVINENEDIFSKQKLEFYLNKNLIKQTENIELLNNKNIEINMIGKKIALIENNLKDKNFDLIFIRNSFISDKNLSFKNIILDKTNNYKSSNFWEEYSKNKSSHFHNIYKNGSFMYSLK